MSLVTQGMGGNSMLVTGGLGFKDLIAQVIEDFGGKQFYKGAKDLTFLKYTFNVSQLAAQSMVNEFDADLGDEVMSEAVSDFLSDKVIEVDGIDYTIQVEPENFNKLVNSAIDLDEKINQVMREVEATRKQAKKILVERAKKELKLIKAHQEKLFKDDFDAIEILLLADEL